MDSVPRHWLIRQREGQSDTSGSYNQTREFPGAEVFEQQKLVLSMVAVPNLLAVLAIATVFSATTVASVKTANPK